MGWFSRDKPTIPEKVEKNKRISVKPPISSPFVASIQDILTETESMRSQGYKQYGSVYDSEFDLFDDMLKLDPELNGAVRAVSLTGNKYKFDYAKAKNKKIRESVEQFVIDVDLDDFIINTMRNLLVYGNSIDKIVGRAGVGITALQSIPITQVTIVDERPNSDKSPRAYGKDDPIMEANTYRFREQERGALEIPADEISHIKLDYRSNWHRDRLSRWTYGVWGASRFSSLKQAIRAKYNTMNNRIAIEDSMTKQYISIDMSAVEHITDPNEQRERLSHIMKEVGKLLEGLRADQIPILPDYVSINQMDMKNVPDNSGFLDMINSDISAVLQVPRVAAGQESGSTFAATFNANMWSMQAIARLQEIVTQAVQGLLLKHLLMAGIVSEMKDLPILKFEPVDEENNYQEYQRVSLGFRDGIITRDEAREMLGFPEGITDGFKDGGQTGTRPISPRPQQQDTNSGGEPDNE
tara:strand:+ start:5550 stop:6953 length:1404 start_codon:yes stop_codon:yes gene_type:complete